VLPDSVAFSGFTVTIRFSDGASVGGYIGYCGYSDGSEYGIRSIYDIF
jgi:hypothetical protein